MRNRAASDARAAAVNSARLIFFIADGEMVLLHGFEKKTQKTPTQEINLALARKRDLE